VLGRTSNSSKRVGGPADIFESPAATRAAF
jgi:hypothetical protein